MKVVVGIKFNQKLVWIWGDEDLWYLNFNLIDTTLISEDSLLVRKGFESLSAENISNFIKSIKNMIIGYDDLHQNIEREDINLYPALLIDFDNNIFYDNFPEPNNYSLAINEDWTYSYDDLDTVVDASEQYWK